MARWERLKNAEVEKRSKKKHSSGSTSPETTTTTSKKKLKPPKFTSAKEQDKWMRENGMGGF